MCLEDNLIIYYKHFLYLLSLPVGRAALITRGGRTGRRACAGAGATRERDNCTKFQPTLGFDTNLKAGVIKVIESSSLIFLSHSCLILSY